MSPRGGTLDHLVGPGGTDALSEEFYRQVIYRHKKRKLEDPVSTVQFTFQMHFLKIFHFCVTGPS